MIAKLLIRISVCAVWLLISGMVFGSGTLPAFPGAEGYGGHTIGGRGGRAVYVNTLAAKGTGSFYHALVEVSGPRTIVFGVSGIIDCKNEVGFRIDGRKLKNDHVTIAGETSPGGIALYNYKYFKIKNAKEVIIRFLRLRGVAVNIGDDQDGISIMNGRNIIIDHVSVAGASDETISITRHSENVTIQWTGFDESRWFESHQDYFKSDAGKKNHKHNYGSLITKSGPISLHHNLFTHHSKRTPTVGQGSGGARVEFINNVIYNYSNEQWRTATVAYGPGLVVVNNFYKFGPDSVYNAIPVRQTVTHVKGNVSVTMNGGRGPNIADRGTIGSVNIDRMETAWRAYRSVTRLAGALPHDATSRRMTFETQTGSGRQGYSPRQDLDAQRLRAYGTVQDKDRDGLPDWWEKENNLDPKNPKDGYQVTKDGYTYLEHYCHSQAERLIQAQLAQKP